MCTFGSQHRKSCFPPYSCRGITPLPSTVGDAYCKDLKCTTTNRVGNGWVPNLKDTNTCFGNPICSVIPKLLRSIKSKPTISRIYCKSYYKTIKSPSARTQSSAIQLCSSKLHLPLQLSFLDLFTLFQFHHPSCDAALLLFPEFAVPAEDSKGQEKDQNQW